MFTICMQRKSKTFSLGLAHAEVVKNIRNIVEGKGYIQMQKIIVNKIKCIKCGDVIESSSIHDFRFCKCGSVAVDGGRNYLRRCGNREDWEELSEIEV